MYIISYQFYSTAPDTENEYPADVSYEVLVLFVGLALSSFRDQDSPQQSEFGTLHTYRYMFIIYMHVYCIYTITHIMWTATHLWKRSQYIFEFHVNMYCSMVTCLVCAVKCRVWFDLRVRLLLCTGVFQSYVALVNLCLQCNLYVAYVQCRLHWTYVYQWSWVYKRGILTSPSIHLKFY